MSILTIGMLLMELISQSFGMILLVLQVQSVLYTISKRSRFDSYFS